MLQKYYQPIMIKKQKKKIMKAPTYHFWNFQITGGSPVQTCQLQHLPCIQWIAMKPLKIEENNLLTGHLWTIKPTKKFNLLRSLKNIYVNETCTIHLSHPGFDQFPPPKLPLEYGFKPDHDDMAYEFRNRRGERTDFKKFILFCQRPETTFQDACQAFPGLTTRCRLWARSVLLDCGKIFSNTELCCNMQSTTDDKLNGEV